MSNKNKIVWLVFILGLLFRFTFVILHPYPDGHDAYQYDLIATNIINGHGISQEINPPYPPQIDRVPFYPIFMSFFYLIFGHHLVVIRIVQAILSILTAFFVYFITRKIISDDRLSHLPILSLALTLLCPFLILFVSILFTETLVAFLVTLSLLLFIYGINEDKKIFYFFSGLITGLAFMTRPEAFAFPFVLSVVFFFNNLNNFRKAVKYIGIFLLPFFIIWGAWIARNYLAFHRFAPISAQDGALLLIGTYPPVRYEKYFPEEIKEEYMRFPYLTETERIAVTADMRKRAFERIRKYPLRCATYYFQRIPILWIGSYWHYLGRDDTFSDLFMDIRKSRKDFFIKSGLILLKVSLFIISIFYVVSGILGMILWIKKWKTIYPLYLTLIYFTVILMPLGGASTRHTIKIMPIFLIFSALGILHVYYWIKENYKKGNACLLKRI